ncbi:antirestriction protein ArdA [Amycolatopsis dendrobii]|uniref:Antirestriction protein ArdA n=1 Tax=Amycolatopsis dendrobii TaxID=2760662 RepID=A0A7W3VTP4_9PSEU|nr:antirestriction protein ArdA [Amycolatopsis dendrobii]MBB1152462.1 antirestriction protein ArdA [Amycolatopsis dendrobii]
MEPQPEHTEPVDDADTDPWHRTAERQQARQPRVYVTDLASTERGIDHGLWVDANQSADDIAADIDAMLASSPVPGAKLWVVRATEDFDDIDLSTVSTSAAIAELAQGLVRHGRAFTAWVRHIDHDYTRLADFPSEYVGSYQSPEAWAWSLAESLGWHQELDRRITDTLIRPYVTLDYAAIAQDASASWHVLRDPDGTVHVFTR